MNKKETLSFSGHREHILLKDYYKLNLLHKSVDEYQRRLKKICSILIKRQIQEGYRNFMTGGATGFDTWMFFLINDIKAEYPNLQIKNILVLPYRDSSNRILEYEHRNNEMIRLADEVIYVDEQEGYENKLVKQGHYAKSKLFRRNDYMIDNSNYLISLFNGNNSGTKHAIDYSRKSKQHGLIMDSYTLLPKEVY